jgi:hypothetical protein
MPVSVRVPVFLLAPADRTRRGARLRARDEARLLRWRAAAAPVAAALLLATALAEWALAH